MVLTRFSGRKGRARQPPLSSSQNCRTFAEVYMKFTPKYNLLCGIAINDADYQVVKKITVNGSRKVVWSCSYYTVWHSMITRCYSQRFLKRHKTYEGCRVCDDWLIFSKFKDWMSQQNWHGKHLDKDLLFPGNRIYSPETCVFIPAALNNFLVNGKARRGKYPLGVYWNKQRKKFEARCSDPAYKKQVPLGRYDSAQDAHLAWRKKKTRDSLQVC